MEPRVVRPDRVPGSEYGDLPRGRSAAGPAGTASGCGSGGRDEGGGRIIGWTGAAGEGRPCDLRVIRRP